MQVVAQPKVLILPFEGDASLEGSLLDFVGSQFIAEITNLNVPNVYDWRRVGASSAKKDACNTLDCKQKQAQSLGMDNMILSRLVRFGSSYALSVEVLDVQSRSVLKSVTERAKGDFEDIFEELCSKAAVKIAETLEDETEVNAAPAAIAATPVSTDEEADDWVETTEPVDPPKPIQQVVILDAVPDAVQLTPPPQLIPGGIAPPPQIIMSPQPQVTPSSKMSTKRKVAIAVGVASLGSAGGGIYFNSQVNTNISDLNQAINSRDSVASHTALDKVEANRIYRNTTYAVSMVGVIAAVVLWIWPEK